ncbi:glucosamine inositolphosphorylceramide transferase family protein [Pseudidiomarina salilacus]|uniref:glucosamine inositolphosphorylceramide transferase family protein n=1 Tax=Pseudidiomarina salilacus TaxID=3384452 RepID=UPI003984C16E
MSSDRERLRVGLLVPDAPLDYLVTDLVKRSLSSEHYEISALVIQHTNSTEAKSGHLQKLKFFIRQNGFKGLFARTLWALVLKLEGILLRQTKRYQHVQSKAPLTSLSLHKIIVNPEVSKSGLVVRFNRQDLERIAALKLDALVMAGGGILKGDILSVTRFGVISFHHADNRLNRGAPAGFWEVFERQAVTGFIIQRLTEELDGGDVLARASIATSAYYLLNNARVKVKSSIFMHQLLEQLGQSNRLPEIEESLPYSNRLYRKPSFLQLLKYMMRTYSHIAKKLFRKIIKSDVDWEVAYLRSPNWRTSVLWKAKTIANPPGRFLADPIVASSDAQDVIFVEDYDLKTRTGSVSAIEVKEDTYELHKDILVENCHLSYPYVFKADQTWFMCPETSQLDQIRLYESVEFPFKWKFKRVLIDHIKAVDTNIIFHDGRWWLFATVDSSDLGDAFSELHIFYADNLESDEWKPHAKNPIITDALTARNGGKIEQVNGKLYRPFQYPAYDTYGKGVGVAEIVLLTADDYDERVIVDIKPNFKDNIDGIHSYSHSNGIVAVDFFRFRKRS